MSPSISSFDLMLHRVVELEAVRPEQLDAVIVEQIVRGGDHDAEIGAHRARQHADRGRRHRAEQQHVHADRGEAGDQGGFDHVAGQAGVLADDDAVAVFAVAKHQPGGLPDLERQFRRNHAIGPAANAVGAKILANHEPLEAPSLLMCWERPPAAPRLYRESVRPFYFKYCEASLRDAVNRW